MAASVLKGNIVSAPELGKLEITEKGYMVLEDGKFYPMMKVVPTEEALSVNQEKQDVDDAYGELLLKQKHPVLKEQLENRYTFVKGLIGNLAGSETESARARLSDFEAEKKLLEQKEAERLAAESAKMHKENQEREKARLAEIVAGCKKQLNDYSTIRRTNGKN